ncbi:hypothetical protein FB45DRAFT_944505 [Roridomyces roridus]|uniref:Uncharacterized protein n=1 Tax=Roridomyces roridus TaxID=1738132 RepID=A0AAD7B383_9AGAR|nr:hypothetical protein FB45DRAFT_944505 [Roridomyces roridus]
MSSTEDLIFTFGEIIYRNTVPHCVGFTFYGIYLIFFCAYLSLASRSPLQSRGSKILLAAMILLFLSSTGQFVLDMTFSLEQIKGYLMWTQIPLPDRRDLWDAKYEAIFVLERWPMAINFMISDLIVIWRASVLYTSRRRVQAMLWTVAAADVALWIAAGIVTSRDASQRSRDPQTDEVLNAVSNFISLGTNLVGTGAIFVRGWQQKKLMTEVVGKWRGDVPRILHILVETGSMWAIVQVVFAVLQQTDPANFTPLDMAVAVIGKAALYLAMCFILPVLIFLY